LKLNRTRQLLVRYADFNLLGKNTKKYTVALFGLEVKAKVCACVKVSPPERTKL
jgi:hypothetical protein